MIYFPSFLCPASNALLLLILSDLPQLLFTVPFLLFFPTQHTLHNLFNSIAKIAIMGLTEIRTAAKVDLKRAADQQDVLHVSRLSQVGLELAKKNFAEQMASRWQAPPFDVS